jgi:hypothetical protein
MWTTWGGEGEKDKTCNRETEVSNVHATALRCYFLIQQNIPG